MRDWWYKAVVRPLQWNRSEEFFAWAFLERVEVAVMIGELLASMGNVYVNRMLCNILELTGAELVLIESALFVLDRTMRISVLLYQSLNALCRSSAFFYLSYSVAESDLLRVTTEQQTYLAKASNDTPVERVVQNFGDPSCLLPSVKDGADFTASNCGHLSAIDVTLIEEGVNFCKEPCKPCPIIN
ncbi:hypothetical protein ARMSODRAFT_981949 [Armillaria solidipes]|uniref:Uncharacterized protein n=1 Tax=Armillaria solidipes TaxID=1076256 RepID=A0A2H3B4C9_9AGAR|nr:hypothetical protein ARMSODRAFT_981949 [Armillaria solidipes]